MSTGRTEPKGMDSGKKKRILENDSRERGAGELLLFPLLHYQMLFSPKNLNKVISDCYWPVFNKRLLNMFSKHIKKHQLYSYSPTKPGSARSFEKRVFCSVSLVPGGREEWEWICTGWPRGGFSSTLPTLEPHLLQSIFLEVIVQVIMKSSLLSGPRVCGVVHQRILKLNCLFLNNLSKLLIGYYNFFLANTIMLMCMCVSMMFRTASVACCVHFTVINATLGKNVWLKQTWCITKCSVTCFAFEFGGLELW